MKLVILRCADPWLHLPPSHPACTALIRANLSIKPIPAFMPLFAWRGVLVLLVLAACVHDAPQMHCALAAPVCVGPRPRVLATFRLPPCMCLRMCGSCLASSCQVSGQQALLLSLLYNSSLIQAGEAMPFSVR